MEPNRFTQLKANQEKEQGDRRGFPQAFQQNKRDRKEPSPYASHDYQRWKRKDEKVVAKQPDVSSTADFPSLVNHEAPKKPSALDGISLAEKLKQTIAAEQEEATLRRYSREADEKNDKDIWIPLSLSKFRQAPKEKEEDIEMEAGDEEFGKDDWHDDENIQRY